MTIIVYTCCKASYLTELAFKFKIMMRRENPKCIWVKLKMIYYTSKNPVVTNGKEYVRNIKSSVLRMVLRSFSLYINASKSVQKW